MPKTRKNIKSADPMPEVEKSKSVQKKISTTKPKKYTKKTVDQFARIYRSKNDRIFLLNASHDTSEEVWKFMVQGTKGNNYHVDIHTSVKCTCIDFRMKKKPCKHIYFIVTQVAQNQKILDYFKNDTKISKAAYRVLDQQLESRLRSRLRDSQDSSKKDIDLKDDTDCTICFTEMDKQEQSLEGCSTCKKYFHQICLTAWKNYNSTCPLCRGPLAESSSDPLSKLKQIKI